MMRACIVALPLLMLAAACGNAENAGSFTAKCRGAFMAGSSTLVYEGGAKGTLKAVADFGEMTLPATRMERQNDSFEVPIVQIGIVATGPATIRMSDLAAIEDCITKRGETDEDMCSDLVPDAANPIPATARVTLSIIEPPEAHFAIERSYLENSAVVGGRPITILTSGGCTIEE